LNFRCIVTIYVIIFSLFRFFFYYLFSAILLIKDRKGETNENDF
jgi:hypothetical protein